MNIEDLQYIFKDQLTGDSEHLYFILEDNNYRLVCKEPVSNLENLVVMLSSFEYKKHLPRLPKFCK